MPSMLIAAALVVLLAASAFAEPAEVLPRAKTPEEVGLSSSRLARVHAVTAGHIETGHVPGAVILVARHGKIAWFESLGFRDRAAGAPMTKDTLFRIYSMTKPITSVAVMMLVEEGRLQVSDPVSRYLPELAKPKVGVEKTDDGGTLFWIDPQERMIVLYMVQVSDFDRVLLRNQFRTMMQSTIADAPRR